jgi:hypothetical protein
MGNKKIDGLVQERGEQYGEAWKVTGKAVEFFSQYTKRLEATLYWFPWLMILNKLVRILFSPNVVDHWKDIQGYAQLVIDDLPTPRDHTGGSIPTHVTRRDRGT